jgi:hypothetical protein
MMPRIWKTHPQITHQEVARRMLDVVLKKAVIYLHPFAFPGKAGGCVRWCFGGVENDVDAGGCPTLKKTILVSVLILLIQTDL